MFVSRFKIITSIEDNVDKICLLLTCKKLYNNSSLKRSIQFKGIGGPITKKGYISQQFKATINRFKLKSFKDIMSLKLCTNAVNSLINLDLTRFVSLTKFTCGGLLSNIGPGRFPISITSLNIRSTDMLPRDTFLSLTSLVTLKIQLPTTRTHNVTDQLPCIDLFNLNNLTTFRINYFSQDPKYNIEIKVPPSIKILYLESKSIRIPSRYEMPLLEDLYVNQHLLIDGKVIFPASLTHLNILGIYIESVQLPQSLIKLKQRIDESSLPQQLKKLHWKAKFTNLIFQSFYQSSNNNNDNYPPHLETLNFFDIQGDFKINIPPITKNLSISLNPNLDSDDPQIYSISTRINKPTIDQSQWLPINTTHLTCFLKDSRYNKMMAFRLDEVINHTNVRYLTLSLYNSKLQFSIQRLDPEKKSVLVLERQTLTGGIITQRKSINNQQQYDPIYLYYDYTSPFEFYWKF
ncbi:hypothetical protein DFA_02396 [Cavenderia fasciculata]|uniref:FNIP repeat-containing protein n=1 Tax=Cavenderia fasciculata TaxID=261658 RepID=F4PZC0_CACFS|nr:uncharacterized protein DFA_02396 [Cavenderia fasciculata]EGG19149.1 hypothetical protein DFA_02396 [Cavenderia fasciculata]|eukprot:XP_004366782.1 hypothetical protein DFA_02396 [Cavenderia fasciculata]